jgi:uncharacterized protein YozE (UPF0346 family)
VRLAKAAVTDANFAKKTRAFHGGEPYRELVKYIFEQILGSFDGAYIQFLEHLRQFLPEVPLRVVSYGSLLFFGILDASVEITLFIFIKNPVFRFFYTL